MTRSAALVLLAALLLTGCSVDEEVHGGYIDGPHTRKQSLVRHKRIRRRLRLPEPPER